MKPEEIMDIMFSTVKQGVTTFEELASALPSTIGMARTLGISFEDLTGTLAATSTGFASMAETATGFEAVMTEFVRGKPKFIQGLEELGLSYGDLRDMMAGPEGVVGAFRAMIDAAEGREDILFKMLGRKQAIQFMSVVKDKLDFIEESIENNKNAAGAADEAYDKMADTFSKRVDIMKQKINELAISLGEELLPVLEKDVLPNLEKAVDYFINLDPEIKKGVVAVIALTGALATLGVLIGPLSAGLGLIAGILGSKIVLGATAAIAVFYVLMRAVTEFNNLILKAAIYSARFMASLAPGGLTSQTEDYFEGLLARQQATYEADKQRFSIEGAKRGFQSISSNLRGGLTGGESKAAPTLTDQEKLRGSLLSGELQKQQYNIFIDGVKIREDEIRRQSKLA